MEQRFNILSRLCLVGVVSLALSAGCVRQRTDTFKVALLTPGPILGLIALTPLLRTARAYGTS